MANHTGSNATLHVYPGMGATAAMYDASAWQSLASASFHDWPEWRGEATLPDWAKRLIAEHNIAAGDIVCGSSLGGMIAAEIANQINVGGLVLLGSAQHPSEVNRLLSRIHPLIDLAPLAFVQMSAGKIPMELSTMFAQSDAAFIRAMCRAIFQWQGLQAQPRMLRIHGKKDRVIPPPDQVDAWLPCGHLVAMDEPEACSHAIVEFLTNKSHSTD
ncbi:alpha/beta fold hydrolase [Cerasicoccus maritimus]|uniref:alpha/beta fold hydrolase n=1 Tax=Cerasicoccus maritimus TaxID=490089 RepID=UPI0028525D36|nr:alpha/beta hydrolase [Cerasicoccus maritimus]